MTDEQNDGSGVTQPDPVIGTPERDSLAFPGRQSYPDTCAIRCQEYILEQFTGLQFDEDALVQEAAAEGWYEGGTSLEDVGKQLELHGVAVNRYEDANSYTLAAELARGHKVIIGVDSGELWGESPVTEFISDALGIDGADHAVVVSGIDTTNPAEPRVIISDPGTGEAVASYPMDDFLDAWKDSEFFMVSTQEPAPNTLPEMVNFDYATGHIPEVAGMPYEAFAQLAEQPDAWDEWLTAGDADAFDDPSAFVAPDADGDGIPDGFAPDDDAFSAAPDTTDGGAFPEDDRLMQELQDDYDEQPSEESAAAGPFDSVPN